jgi:hypothetical protein
VSLYSVALWVRNIPYGGELATPGSRRRWSRVLPHAHIILCPELQRHVSRTRDDRVYFTSMGSGRTRVDDCKHRRIPVSGIRSSAIRASVTRTAARPPSISSKRQNNASRSRTPDTSSSTSGVHLDQGEAMFGIPLSPLRKCYSVHHSLWVDLRV